jgi:hypothetical protein
MLFEGSMTRNSIGWARFSPGDRLQVDDWAPYQYPFACFALVPACLAVGAELRRSLIAQSHPGILWLVLMGACIAFYAGALVWARLIPAMASFAVGSIGWSVELWILFHGTF